MHGGKAASGTRNGNYRTGLHAKVAIAERRMLRELIAETKATMREMV